MFQYLDGPEALVRFLLSLIVIVIFRVSMFAELDCLLDSMAGLPQLLVGVGQDLGTDLRWLGSATIVALVVVALPIPLHRAARALGLRAGPWHHLRSLRWPAGWTVFSLMMAARSPALLDTTLTAMSLVGLVLWAQLATRGAVGAARALFRRFTAPWRNSVDDILGPLRHQLGNEIGRVKHSVSHSFCLLAFSRTHPPRRSTTAARAALTCRLTESLRCYDTAVVDREGVLLLLLPDTARTACHAVVQRVRQAFAHADPSRVADQGIVVGVVCCPDDGLDVEVLLGTARRRMLPYTDAAGTLVGGSSLAGPEWFVEELETP